MNQSRLQSFILAYGEGLAAAVTANRHRFRMEPGDTPQTRALRTAMTVADLLERRGPQAIEWSGEGFRNACRALGIEHDERAITAYLEGAP